MAYIIIGERARLYSTVVKHRYSRFERTGELVPYLLQTREVYVVRTRYRTVPQQMQTAAAPKCLCRRRAGTTCFSSHLLAPPSRDSTDTVAPEEQTINHEFLLYTCKTLSLQLRIQCQNSCRASFFFTRHSNATIAESSSPSTRLQGFRFHNFNQ